MKRFTDTEKWSDPWFRRLHPSYKSFWMLICDRCDCAGVWKPDFELASFVIGDDVSLDEAKAAMNGRITVLPSGDWLINRFVEFQYGKLSPNCKPHLAILKTIDSHRVCKGYPKGTHTLEEKEKEKEQEEEKEGTAQQYFPEQPSWEAVKSTADLIGLPEWRVKMWFDEMEGCGWVDKKGRKVCKWQSVLNTVKAYWEADGRPTGPKTFAPANSKPTNGASAPTGASALILAQNELKRIEDRIKAIRAGASEDAWGAHYTQAQKDELNRLKAKQKELKSQLGFTV